MNNLIIFNGRRESTVNSLTFITLKITLLNRRIFWIRLSRYVFCFYSMCYCRTRQDVGIDTILRPLNLCEERGEFNKVFIYFKIKLFIFSYWSTQCFNNLDSWSLLRTVDPCHYHWQTINVNSILKGPIKRHPFHSVAPFLHVNQVLNWSTLKSRRKLTKRINQFQGWNERICCFGGFYLRSSCEKLLINTIYNTFCQTFWIIN